MPNWKKVIVSGSDASLNSLTVPNGITGSLEGTSSFATTASYAANVPETASFAISASQAISASYSLNADTASYFITSSVTSASYALNADTASYFITSSVTSASYALNADTASYFVTSSVTSASYADFSTTASYALTSSYSNNINGSTNHIPVFDSPNSLVTSSIYQSGGFSIIINQDNNTSAAPEALYVWQPSTESFNVISGKGNLNNYLQLNIQNLNNGTSASSDVVATANNGTETTFYIDMGINNQNYINNGNGVGSANDAYLYSVGNHLHIGNAANEYLGFFAGGFDVDANMKLLLSPTNYHEMTGSLDISGSLIVQDGITGSLQGTASFALNALSASYAFDATTASFALNFNPNATASYAISASQAVTASYAINATTASYAINATSASYAATSSYADNFTVAGTLTAQTINVQVITSSTEYVTGSTIFGSELTNTHQFTGSVSITGSLIVNDSAVVLTNQTSSMSVLTASYANNTTSASYADTSTSSSYASVATSASYANNSTSASYASVATSASYSDNSTSASYALTASYVANASSFPYTGSAIISGSLEVIGTTTTTGSLITSGSNKLIGDTSLTGSVTISGSTVQIGNNSLFGNTSLSGSIIISGSENPSTPTIQIFGDTQHTGVVRFNPISRSIDNSVSASYIYVSGSTNDLYFSQNGNGYANTTRLRWLEGNLYTGLLNGGIITSQSSTVYQVSSGSGIIVNLNASLNDNPYPTIQYLNWPNLSASIAPLTASYQQAFVGIDSTNNIYQQGTPFIDGQYDTLINIGLVLFQNGSTINGFKTQPSVAYGFEQAQNTFNRAFGPLKLSGLTLAPSGSSTGSLVVGSGTAYAPGSNYTIDPNNPSYAIDPGTNTSKIYRYYQSGSTWVYLTNAGAGFTTIDPSQYSNSGSLASVGNNEWSIQRAFWFPNSAVKAIIVYYGNQIYSTEADAFANLNIEPFIEAPNTAANAVYLGAIIIKGNGVFTSAADYKLVPGGLFRSVGGSGGGGSTITQTLSGLSDVSITGQTNLQPLVYSTTAGKWINSSNISGSLFGNAQTATSASHAINSDTAISSSYANVATSASYALSASQATNAITASYILQAVSASYAISSSYALSASQATNSNTAISSSYAATSSYADNFTVANQLTATTLVVQTISSSVVYSSGSNIFGNNLSNTQVFTGSVSITGSFIVNGPATINNLTGSLQGTASFASNALSSSFATLAATASYFLTSSVTSASFATSASYASSSTSASYALNATNAITASYILNAVSSSFATSASYAISSSFAATASYFLTSSVTSASFATSASYALSASQAQNANIAVSSSYAATSSYADNFTVKSTFTLDATLNDYSSIASTISGTNNLFTQSTGSYTSAFFKYTARNSTNSRTGEVMAVWNGASVEFTDVSTRDLGTTSAVTMSVILVGADVEFNAITNTSGWSVKSLATFM